MDDENRIDEASQFAQKEPEAASLRMEQAAAFWNKYDDDTLPPVLQAFKARAVEFVRALPDSELENEEIAYYLPPQLEDWAGEAGMTPSLKERLWQRVFSEERDRRGIADPNDYAEPLDDEAATAAPVGATHDEVSDAPDEPTSGPGEEDFPEDPAAQ